MKTVLPKHLTDISAIEMIWGPPDQIMDATTFRPYQNWMTSQIIALPRLLLGAECGLGKTAAALKAVAKMLDTGGIKSVLIVAPMRVAEETWPEEIQKWAFARHLRYRVVTGTVEERIAALRHGPCEVTIINRENLRWLLKYLGIRRWKFDMMIYDEVSRLKGGKLESTPAKRPDGTYGDPRMTELGVIYRCHLFTPRFVGLSGTPAPNGLIDLWGPMFAVDNGERLGRNISAYKKRWFIEEKYTYGVEPRVGAEAQIMEAIKDRFFSLSEEDYLTLPPLIERIHLVRLPPAIMLKYKKFEREMATEIQTRAGDKEMIEAVNAGVLTGKLLQFANGSLYENVKFDEDTDKRLPREATVIHKLKLDALDSIVQESMGQPMLVAYSFQFDKEAILKRFPQCRLYGDSVSDKRDWNAGKIPMLLIHPASAGHGLNFQFGSNIAVWYGLNWSSELFQQFVKRLHRSGQKRDHVMMHYIVAKGTADETILPVLRERKVTEDRLKRAVKARLERIIYDSPRKAA